MEEEKKYYIKPEAILIVFDNDDIISISEFSTNGFLLDGETEKW